jgi:hypothetical protein
MGFKKLNVRWTNQYFGSEYAVDDNIIRVVPSPTPSSTPSPSPTKTPTPTPTPSSTPSPSPTPSLTPSPSPTPSLTPTKTPTPTPTETPVFSYYEATKCDEISGSTYIVKSNIQLFFGDVISVFEDPSNCYEIGGVVSGPSFDYQFNTSYPDCSVCLSILASPTPTPTPSLTPTLTPTPTPSITPSAQFFIYDAQDCNDPFANPVVVKSTSFLVIGSSVKVVGDDNTCYEILNTGFPPEDFIVNTTYTDCGDCSATLPTPTPTPTKTATPTPTPTPTCDCEYVSITISQNDLNSAGDNNDLSLDGKVFLDYIACGDNSISTKFFDTAGVYTDDVCVSPSTIPDDFTLYYYEFDEPVIASSSSYTGTGVNCCNTISPTPTPTPTPTP